MAEVDVISSKARKFGEIRFEGKGISKNVWAHFVTCFSELGMRGFLHCNVSEDETKIHHNNFRKRRVKFEHPSTSIANLNSHHLKERFYICWDQKEVVYSELQKPGKTLTVDRYR